MTKVWEPLHYPILPLKELSELPKNSREAQSRARPGTQAS